MQKVLTIAGSDSGGGAGIQADIKSISANHAFAVTVITAITAQNTQGVFSVQNLSVDLIKAQLDAILSDINVDAIKIGMLSSSEIINIVVKVLQAYKIKNIIIDPVMISKSGYALLDNKAGKSLQENLIPIADLLTPNLHEATALTGLKAESITDMKTIAAKIHTMGAKAVLVKGGHLEQSEAAVDILFDGKNYKEFTSNRLVSNNTHGTGCSLSAAIAALIANGQTLEEAVKNAKIYVYNAIKNGFKIGQGVGVLHHFHKFY